MQGFAENADGPANDHVPEQCQQIGQTPDLEREVRPYEEKLVANHAEPGCQETRPPPSQQRHRHHRGDKADGAKEDLQVSHSPPRRSPVQRSFRTPQPRTPTVMSGEEDHHLRFPTAGC